MNSVDAALANSRTAIQSRVEDGQITAARPVWMLFSRLVLFGVVQALFALCFVFTGQPQPWQASIAWWPVSVTISNLVCLFLLDRVVRREGMRLVDLYRVEQHHFWRECLIVLGVALISAPLSMAPNILLGNLLFGDVQISTEMFFRPLPLWVVIIFAGMLFPLTIALTEIPTYYGYAMPRLTAINGRGWLTAVFAGFMHAAQHITLPLIFDVRFISWRLLMFLPFAVFLAFVLQWRPRLMPYLMVMHALMDFSLLFMLLPAAVH